MLVATGVASAAVERRKASAPRCRQVAPTARLPAARAALADEWRKLRRLVCVGADIGWMRLSALRFPFVAGSEF